MDLNRTSQIHAAIITRHESPAFLDTTYLHSVEHTQNGHSHIVSFFYHNEETGVFMKKSFDGKKWST